MRRRLLVCAACAVMLLPTPAKADGENGVYTYSLPFFWVKLDIIGFLLSIPLGYCQGPANTPGLVQCSVEKHGPEHYSGVCRVELVDEPLLTIAGAFHPNGDAPGGGYSIPTLAFGAEGIACQSTVPFLIRVQKWDCAVADHAFTCHWCWHGKCYEGGATLTVPRN